MNIIRKMYYDEDLKERYRSTKLSEKQKELYKRSYEKMSKLEEIIGAENKALLLEYEDAVWNVFDEEGYREFWVGWRIGADFTKKRLRNKLKKLRAGSQTDQFW